MILPRFVVRQRETCGGYGFKPVSDSSRAPADSEMAYLIEPAAVATVWAVWAVWVLVEVESAVDVEAYARC